MSCMNSVGVSVPVFGCWKIKQHVVGWMEINTTACDTGYGLMFSYEVNYNLQLSYVFTMDISSIYLHTSWI
jgi:hypothetical protein